MFNNMCIICRDKNRLRIRIDDAKRIFNRLQLIINKYKKCDIKIDKIDAVSLYNKISDFRTTCGHCTMLNTSELQSVEKKLVDIVLKVKFLLKSDCLSKEEKARLKNEANTLLRGFYVPLSQYILRT